MFYQLLRIDMTSTDQNVNEHSFKAKISLQVFYFILQPFLFSKWCHNSLLCRMWEINRSIITMNSYKNALQQIKNPQFLQGTVIWWENLKNDLANLLVCRRSKKIQRNQVNSQISDKDYRKVRFLKGFESLPNYSLEIILSFSFFFKKKLDKVPTTQFKYFTVL